MPKNVKNRHKFAAKQNSRFSLTPRIRDFQAALHISSKVCLFVYPSV